MKGPIRNEDLSDDLLLAVWRTKRAKLAEARGTLADAADGLDEVTGMLFARGFHIGVNGVPYAPSHRAERGTDV